MRPPTTFVMAVHAALWLLCALGVLIGGWTGVEGVYLANGAPQQAAAAAMALLTVILPYVLARSWDELTVRAIHSRICAFCAERISPEALVCRYCGREQSPYPAASSRSIARGPAVAFAVVILALVTTPGPMLSVGEANGYGIAAARFVQTTVVVLGIASFALLVAGLTWRLMGDKRAPRALVGGFGIAVAVWSWAAVAASVGQ